jgi:DNA-binding NtrC family response regulator
MMNSPMSTHLALVVDDEPDIRELLEITLGRMNINTRSAASLQEALMLLESDKFDICLTCACPTVMASTWFDTSSNRS